METKKVKISAQFGHEIAAVNFAKAFNLPVVIIPNKDNREDYEKEAETILNNMSFFYDRITIVPFEEKEAANASAWDIIGDLKAGTHTWLLLTMFPDIPQLILFNKKGVERWKAIEAAYQKQGYNIICLGFDENTDMAEFAKEIETNYAKLFA